MRNRDFFFNFELSGDLLLGVPIPIIPFLNNYLLTNYATPNPNPNPNTSIRDDLVLSFRIFKSDFCVVMNHLDANWDDSYILDVFHASVRSHEEGGSSLMTEAESKMRRAIALANSSHTSHQTSYGHLEDQTTTLHNTDKKQMQESGASPYVGEVVDLQGIFGKKNQNNKRPSPHTKPTPSAPAPAPAPAPAGAMEPSSASFDYTSSSTHAQLASRIPTQEALATMLRAWYAP